MEAAPPTPTVADLISSVPALDQSSAQVLVPLVNAYGSWAGLALHITMLEKLAGDATRLQAELDRLRVHSTDTLAEMVSSGASLREDKARLERNLQELRSSDVDKVRLEKDLQESTRSNTQLRQELEDHVATIASLQGVVDTSTKDTELLEESERFIGQLEAQVADLQLQLQTMESTLQLVERENQRHRQKAGLFMGKFPVSGSTVPTTPGVRDALRLRMHKRARLDSLSETASAAGSETPVEGSTATVVATTEHVTTTAEVEGSTEQAATAMTEGEVDVELGHSDNASPPPSPSARSQSSLVVDTEEKAEPFPPFTIQSQGIYSGIDSDHEPSIRVWGSAGAFTPLVASTGISSARFVFDDHSPADVRACTGSLRKALQATGATDKAYGNPLATWFRTDSPPKVPIDVSSVQFLQVKSFLELEKSRPWDRFLLGLPMQSRTFDYAQLTTSQQKWVRDFYQFLFEFRREWWERHHWLPLSSLHENSRVRLGMKKLSASEQKHHAFWVKAYQNRKTRHSAFVNGLKPLFATLQRDLSSSLPRCFCFEPCFPLLDTSLVLWNPLSNDLVSDLRRLDLAEPERGHWEDFPGGHPFYRYDLTRWYRSVYPIPLEVVPTPWREALRIMDVACLSPLAIAVATPQVSGLNYRGGMTLAVRVRRDKTGSVECGSPPDLDSSLPSTFAELYDAI